MCAGGDDPFPAVHQATGMKAAEIFEMVLVLAAPLGFAISLIAGVLLLRGRGRALSLAALTSLCAAIALLLWAGGPYNLPYSTKRFVEALGAVMALAAIFALYLRHTYAPSRLKRVNLPATLGLATSLACALLLLATR